MAELCQFTYLLRPVRPGFKEVMTAEEEEVVSRHFEYLKRLLADGRLILAGPCLDRAFGVVIFEAESQAAARRTMEDDPAVKAGVMAAELHSFRVSLVRGAA